MLLSNFLRVSCKTENSFSQVQPGIVSSNFKTKKYSWALIFCRKNWQPASHVGILFPFVGHANLGKLVFTGVHGDKNFGESWTALDRRS